jgi:tetratricopeptide (TPR) repeat protein
MAVEYADVLAEAIAHAQLTFASLLDGNGMPYSVFMTAGRQHDVSDSTLAEGLSALEAAGLLSIDRKLDPPLVRANWVVQAAARAATPEAAIGPVANVAAAALLADWPEEAEQPEWLARSFRSTAESLRRIAGDALWQGGCHKLLLRAGRSLDALSAGSVAVDYWSELATVSDRLLGADHPDTLEISEHLARAYLAAGRPGEAIAWFQWVRGDRASRLGLDAPATADASRDLGKALLAAGRAAEAVSALSEAAGGYDHGLGTDSTESMNVRGDLIVAFRAAGELTTAIAAGQRVLADRERVQGTRHPDTLAAAIQLAEVYVADDRAKAATVLLKRVVADAEKVLGPAHQDTIAARAVLASAYYSAGKMASAVQLYEQVRAQYLVALGGGHRRTLSANLNLAHALYGVGRLTDASKLLRETVDSCEAYLPAGDPLTATARESLRNVAGEGSVPSEDSQPAPGQAPEPLLAGEPMTTDPDQFAGDAQRGVFGRRTAGRHRTIR